MVNTKATMLGVCGKRRAGKDTLARRISLYFPNIKVVKLASALKGVAFLFSGNPSVFTPSVDDKARGLLQKVGEGILKNHRLGNDAFVSMVSALHSALRDDEQCKKILTLLWDDEESAAQPVHPVITDVRFPHEERWIHQAGGRVVRITTPNNNISNNSIDKHPSETKTEEVACDLEIPSEVVLTTNKSEFYTKVVRPIAQLTGWEELPTPRKPTVFVAGNICGLPNYAQLFADGQRALEEAGFATILPTDLVCYDDFLAKMNETLYLNVCKAVYAANMRAISRSDAVLALLDHPSMGVAVELLAAFLAEKPVVVCTTKEALLFHPYLWVLSYGHIHTTLDAAIRTLKELFALL